MPSQGGCRYTLKKLIPLPSIVVLNACGQSETPPQAKDSEENIPTVEELASNPDRIKALRQQCKADRSEVGDVLCNRV